MPATPYKRDRRQKSRLDALPDSERVGLRQKAMEMLNRRGGPVDKGPPEEQRKAAERMQGAKREERNERVKASLGRPQINRQEGNPRFGQRYRTILRPGGVVHDYAGNTKDVFVRKSVKPESGGTGNHPPKGMVRPQRTTENVLKPVEQAHKPRPSTYDTMARDLATRRATQNRPNAKRKLFAAARTASYGRADSDQGPQYIKPGSDIRAYRRQQRRYRQRSLQGPSRSQRA